MGGCYEYRELRNEEARSSVRFCASFLNVGVAQQEERSTEPLYSPKDARCEAGSRPAPGTIPREVTRRIAVGACHICQKDKQFKRRASM